MLGDPKRSICLLVLLAAAACSRESQPPQVLRIGLTDDAAPVGEALLACAPQDEDIPVRIERVAPTAAALDEYDLLARLGAPEEETGFAALVAEEQIVLVLNPDNPLQSLTTSQAAEIFAGRVTAWSELGGEEQEISAWIGLEGGEARDLFGAEILRGGRVGGNTRLAGSVEQLLDAVAEDPGAVGVLPAALVDERVKAVEIGLNVPVLVLAAGEPEGAARQLVACLQSGAGRDFLDGQYPREGRIEDGE